MAIDVAALLSTYLNSTLKHIRGFEFCAAMSVRNVYTSVEVLSPMVRNATCQNPRFLGII